MRRILFLAIALSWAAAVSLLPSLQAGGQAQQPLNVQALRENIYWVEGGVGANTGFRIGKDSVVVIDAKMVPEAAREMLAKIKELTPNPVRYIILTHSDGDHVNGLTGFPKGLTIISSQNTRKEMEVAFEDEKLADLRAYLPTVVFTDRKDLELSDVTIRLFAFGPAHTSGDTVVLFPAQKVAFLGDLAFVGRDPLIHRSKGGTSFGLVKTLKSILTLDADIFVPGHGQALSKPDIEGLLKSIEDKQAKVKDLVAQGKSLDEVKAAFGIGPETEQPGGRRWPSLVEVIYAELTEKK